MSFWPFFRFCCITAFFYDKLRHITTFYDIYNILRHITTYYDILRHITTYYDILRQITCFTVEKHFLSKIRSFKRIYSQICRHMSFLAVFQILLYNYDFLRHITKYYDILRHMTIYYDILRYLRQNTTKYDKIRHITTYYNILRHITT